MATWPSGTKASTSNLDAGTDSPASARADLKTNVDNVNSIIDMFNIATPSNNQILKYNSSTSVFDLAADSTVDLTAPGAIGGTTASAGTFTTLTVNAANDLRLADADSSNYVGFKAPATVTTNKIWTLPSADGTNGQVLSTNGSATLSWATAGGGGGTLNEFVITLNSTGSSLISGTTYQYALTETYDSNSILSISSNAFTLSAGDWFVTLLKSAGGPNANTENQTLILYDVTNSTEQWEMAATNLPATGTRSIIFAQSKYWNNPSSTNYHIRGNIGSSNNSATLFNNVQFLFRKIS
jgi:hypothetical protein